MKAFSGIMILLAFHASAAHAGTLYVGPAETYTTIQSAIDASSNGDVIIVRDGTYTGTGNRDIDFKGKAIHVKSEHGPNRCTVDAWGMWDDYPFRGFVFWSGEGPDSILEGFTVTGGASQHGAGVECYRSSPIIVGNVFTENTCFFCGGECMSDTDRP